MQQRQLRLGDILDDYCPRERRVTNHAVVAMIGSDVKQTRCTTCDAEHEYKHAKVPRQRRKAETPAALYSQVLASGPKRVAHEEAGNNGNHAAGHEVLELGDGPENSVADVEASQPDESAEQDLEAHEEIADQVELDAQPASIDESDAIEQSESDEGEGEPDEPINEEEGPVHRPLIRASLPRPEGQPPPTRPIPEFTIRQPGGRPNRFRPRHQRGGQQQQFGNRSNGNVAGPPRGGGMRQGGGGRPPQGNMSRTARRHGPPGRKRSK
jgi:hypothetical protein